MCAFEAKIFIEFSPKIIILIYTQQACCKYLK